MYNKLSALVTTERLKMSEANREHFDIESADHLKHLIAHPNEQEQIKASLLHRIELHKNKPMFRVPPMLFPFPGESNDDHLKREYAAGGYGFIPFDAFVDDVAERIAKNLGLDPAELTKPIPAEKEQELFEGLQNVNLPL